VIIEKILELLPKMSPVNKSIAQFVVENKSEIGFMSIDQLSEDIGVSKASIVRFAKLLGFTGYNEFKKSIQKEIRIKLRPYEKIVLTELDILPKEKQYKKLAENELNNLKESLSSIKIKEMVKMIEGIKNTRNIYLAGFGASTFLIGIIRYNLFGIVEKPLYTLTGSVSDFSMKIKTLTEDDITLLVTFPPYSKEGEFVAEHTKKKGGKLFLFTDSIACPVFPSADAAILCENNSLLLYNSYISPIAMMQIMLNMLLLDEKENGLHKIRKVMDVEMEGYKKLEET